MHPYLTRLGVSAGVQQFFEPHYHSSPGGDLLFAFGEDTEHYGLGFHKVPAARECWVAGNFHPSRIRQVLISYSAMEAIAWLNKKHVWLNHPEQLLFIAIGTAWPSSSLSELRTVLSGKDINFLLGGDLLAQITALRLAAFMRRHHLSALLLPGEKMTVRFRCNLYHFRQEGFTMAGFEKRSGYRFYMPLLKPRGFNSFFEELKFRAGLR